MIYKEMKGISVPAIGLGTWRMRGMECKDSVKRALNLGYRYIDTGQYYKNESDVRKGIDESNVDREDVFLTTKVLYTDLNYESMIESTLESLVRLQTDYLDLVLIHWPEKEIPLQETIAAMQELRDRGKIRGIGVSNFPPDLLDEALRIEPEIIMDQVEMHPFYKQEELHELCCEEDVLISAYCPLARGRVMGDDLINELARKYDKSPAQVALRWLIQQQNVVAIPKAVPRNYQRQNLEAMGYTLDKGDMDRIFDIQRETSFTYPGFAFW